MAEHEQTGVGRQIVAVARLVRLVNPADAELALVVSDAFQHQGIGSRLMQQLIQVARQEDMVRLIAYLRADNRGMKRLCERFGFSLSEEEESLVATLSIPRAESEVWRRRRVEKSVK